MSEASSEVRAQVARLAPWLVDKGRPDEAVALLAVWAANGPNDSEGQNLLAEALRIDPSARLAQMAFERMEGVAGEHSELAAATAHYSVEAVQRLFSELQRPTFRRAQMGFNNNIKFKGAVYHVQTEDSGLDQPHIITHLFADGGRVIKSHKRSYAAEVQRPDVAEVVRGLMKSQHMEMVLMLRDGRFDAVIEGREVGGMTLLTEAPSVDVKKLSKKKDGEGTQKPAAVAPVAGASLAGPRRFTLHVLRSLVGGPERYEPVGDSVVIGASGAVSLAGERFCHAEEALLDYRQGRLILEDLEGGNGVFFRIRTPMELEMGDEFLVGDQLLRVERNPVADDGPDRAPTYFYSSPKWPSSFRVVQVLEGGALGACVVARGSTLQIGSVMGDLVFADDPLVADQHCVIEEQAGTVVLSDLASRTGVFVRVRGEQELTQGDELVIGRTRLVVDLSPNQ